MNDIRQSYTLNEAATQLGVTADTLRQQVRNGALHTFKRGRMHFVDGDELERYRRDHLRAKPNEEGRA